MAKIERFEDIVAWKRAKDLTVYIYSVTKNIKDYSYRDQLQRAVISITNNIAEGFERQSNKEFKQFLYIAKGSCGEVCSMCLVGAELGYFTEENSERLINESTEVSKIISGLIKAL